MSTTGGTALEALQRTLSAEHAAVYVLAALGGRASGFAQRPADRALRTALDTAYGVHLERRDAVRAMVAAAGGDPVAAEPAYRLPREVADPAVTPGRVRTAALQVQRTCVATYAALVAATQGADRRWAVDALVATAVAEAAFGGQPEALPGLGST